MQSDIKIQIETCILFIMHGQISKTWKNILINSNKIGNEFHYVFESEDFKINIKQTKQHEPHKNELMCSGRVSSACSNSDTRLI